MKEISSTYFIPRSNSRSAHLNKRVRILPLYSFPHLKEFNYKISEHKDRFFVHLDFDAFYAQVEQRDNPNLKGKPVSVGGYGNGKGIVMTASYEARKYGVQTGMSVYQALKKCPDLISLPCYGPKYEAIVLNIMNMLEKYVPGECIEQYSVDEAFVDLSPVAKNFDRAIELTEAIKKNIWEVEELTVSAGLSYNKSYAKLATKMQKPDGFTVIRQEDKEKIYGLKADKLWGIGKRIQRRMWGLNINTIGDIVNANPGLLKKEFGINGTVFYKMARGEDTSEICKREKPEKSLSHNNTLHTPIFKPEDINTELRRMGEYICRKLRSKKLTAKMVSLTIRYDTLEYTSARGELPSHTNDERAVLKVLESLFEYLDPPDRDRKARMFGLSVWELHPDLHRENLSLFENNSPNPYYALDSLKEKYGDKIISLGITR